MNAALQIYSRDFDADFFKLPTGLQARIESSIDRLGMTLDTHSHHRMKGIVAYLKRAEGPLIRAGRLYPNRYMFAVLSRRDKRQ